MKKDVGSHVKKFWRCGMVAWYWLFVTAFIAGAIGLLVGALCSVSGRDREDEDSN